MNRVGDDHEPLIITRNGAQSVVMLSLEDYQPLDTRGRRGQPNAAR
jgi:antitoxin YefM